MEKGLLMIYEGDAQAPSLWPFGQVLRALGRGLRVCILQFAGGPLELGDLASSNAFADRLECRTIEPDLQSEERTSAKRKKQVTETWQSAKELIASGRFHIVVLHCLTEVISPDLLNPHEVGQTLSNRPEGVHVLVTGALAPRSLTDLADLVTEVNLIKEG
ncbi:MAG: cob(I)yrinic acid a,c-diamide adenosyltransferase [Deltaproteobacteria bacterium]|nr:cob(I)yrinic acid a,c-diamide adenosyltransferase [Deltaproteobacteria bacterium]